MARPWGQPSQARVPILPEALQSSEPQGFTPRDIESSSAALFRPFADQVLQQCVPNAHYKLVPKSTLSSTRDTHTDRRIPIAPRMAPSVQHFQAGLQEEATQWGDLRHQGWAGCSPPRALTGSRPWLGEIKSLHLLHTHQPKKL